jgi:hypothetical protein
MMIYMELRRDGTSGLRVEVSYGVHVGATGGERRFELDVDDIVGCPPVFCVALPESGKVTGTDGSRRA